MKKLIMKIRSIIHKCVLTAIIVGNIIGLFSCGSKKLTVNDAELGLKNEQSFVGEIVGRKEYRRLILFKVKVDQDTINIISAKKDKENYLINTECNIKAREITNFRVLYPSLFKEIKSVILQEDTVHFLKPNKAYLHSDNIRFVNRKRIRKEKLLKISD